ncbi:MAG: RNA methyltransferase [Bacilli bacterium]|nr:RNA methyltransferase [Bacilli bacterium]
MVITSAENEKVKKFKKLQKKKYRDEYNQYIVEGHHLILEAFKRGAIEELIVMEGKDLPVPAPYTYYSYDVMKKISSMDNPPEVMALCKRFDENKEVKGDKILVLDGIQDPGNLGTIIRSAVAFNIDTIVLTENTVDLYNPKVLRATQGMMFHINIITRNAMELVLLLQNLGIPVYGTDVSGGVDVRDLEPHEKEKFALVMGNEGNGVRPEINSRCTKKLYIEMNRNVESLNVGIAASILLYELGR